jgi:hypothetical protein
MPKALIFFAVAGSVVLIGLLTSLAVFVPPPPPGKTVTLIWDYPEISTNIVFNVYETTNLSLPMTRWKIVTNVRMLSCVLPVRNGAHFFAVTASNIATGLESDFARR